VTQAGSIARRELLRLGLLGGLGAVLAPRLARAAAQPELLPRVRAVIERWVGPGRFPGMVASLGLPGREPEFIPLGSEGFTDPDPMTPDSLFRIYSMSKPVTGMATMLLIAEGKLGLDQPLADILPAYAHMQVQNTPDGSLTDVRPAKTPITIRHLLTHTAGLGYSIVQQGPLKHAIEEAGLVSGQISRIPIAGLDRGKAVRSLERFADGLARLPLVYEPGTRWSYSLAFDVLGRVIEVVSGTSFDVFLRRRIFEPCDMHSTFFQVPASEARRLTTNYVVSSQIFVPIDKGEDSIFLEKPPYPMGGAGLLGSPRDYDRFLHMLANYGEIDGRRVLPEEAVRLGTGNLLPPGVAGPALLAPGSDFGAGGRVGIGPEAGIYGWAGAAGTVAMVDMKRGIRSAVYAQFMPPDANPMLTEFQRALRTDLFAMMDLRK